MKVKEVKVSQFESQIFVFWDCKPIEVKKYLDKNLRGFSEHIPKWLEDNNDNPPQGVCLSEYGVSPNCVIWLGKAPEKDVANFIHEVSHAVHRIMKHWDIKLVEETQEILAILMGFITKEVLQQNSEKRKR